MTTPHIRAAGRTPGPAGEFEFHTSRVLAYRDDGPIGHVLARHAPGRMPLLPPLIAATVLTVAMVAAQIGDHAVAALLISVLVVLLAGPGSTDPHVGRLDWLSPNLILLIEYGYLATTGFVHGVPKALVFALLGILAFHRYDTAYRTRFRVTLAGWVFTAGLGWEGRLLIAGTAAAAGAATLGYTVLTCYLGALFAAEATYTWRRYDKMIKLP